MGDVMVINGVDLFVDTVGDRDDPAILLVAGAGSALDWWDDEFCRRLAAGGRYVVRYDGRDTGQSVTYPVGAPGYTGSDLAADVVGVLDALGLRRAHLVGISMGGALAQRVAVDFPERVASLVLMSTTLALAGGPDLADLPPMSPELKAHFADPPAEPDWSDRAAVVRYLVDYDRLLSAPAYFDEPHVRRVADRVVDRSHDMAASLTNVWRIEEGEPPRGGPADVRARTLVVHGTADPLFPFGHAEALARALPDAELLPLPGMGHQMPPRPLWPTVIPAILRHTSGGWAAQADRLAARSIARGDPTGWFDRLYAAGAAGEVPMPWDRDAPHSMLAAWARERGLDGRGRRAVVVGCGLGADAEYLAGLGYETLGFDVSEAALAQARRRHPGTPVRYTRGDLLDLPAAWVRAFDLVVEVYTVQALPDPPRRTAIEQVGRLVAPGGLLVVVAFRQDRPGAEVAGPPWPLTRDDIDGFTADGLEPVRVDEVAESRWFAVFQRSLMG